MVPCGLFDKIRGHSSQTTCIHYIFIEYPPIDYYIKFSITFKKLNVKILAQVKKCRK